MVDMAQTEHHDISEYSHDNDKFRDMTKYKITKLQLHNFINLILHDPCEHNPLPNGVTCVHHEISISWSNFFPGKKNIIGLWCSYSVQSLSKMRHFSSIPTTF